MRIFRFFLIFAFVLGVGVSSSTVAGVDPSVRAAIDDAVAASAGVAQPDHERACTPYGRYCGPGASACCPGLRCASDGYVAYCRY
jgi:hypothetical protein